MRFEIRSDGSGSPKGGPAGIGFVVLADGLPFSEGSHPVAVATHQQAELLAAVHALNSLPAGHHVELRSDSKFVVKGFNDWLPEWRARDWRRLTGGPVAHIPLWRRLIAAVERHRTVQFVWIPRAENKQADRLAGQGRMAAVEAIRSPGMNTAGFIS